MKLREVIESLFYSDLSSTSMAERTIENIKEEDLKKLIYLVNDTLTELHTRFLLKERTVILESLVWKSYYELNSKHSFLDTGSNELKYIRDSEWDRFTDDVVKIIGVRNEVGDQLPMNDSIAWASVFTPSYNVVQLTHPYIGQAFEVSYQALHPKLVIKEHLNDTLDQEISLAPPLKEVFFAKIGAKFFSGMSGQEASAKSQELTMKYEKGCDDIMLKDSINESYVNTNTKILLRGFP